MALRIVGSQIELLTAAYYYKALQGYYGKALCLESHYYREGDSAGILWGLLGRLMLALQLYGGSEGYKP